MTSSARFPFPRLVAILAAVMTAALVAVAAAGCGGKADADPAKVAPQGTIMYFAATIRPEGDQKEAVDAIAAKVFRTKNPGARIHSLVDRELRSDPESRGITYAQDIEPWLGKRAAVAITGITPGQTQAAMIVATKDAGKARELVNKLAAKAGAGGASKRKYKDAEYWFDASEQGALGVVGDYLVIGTEPSFRAVVDASAGEGLTAKPGFEEAASNAGDRLGFGYVDSRAVLNAASATGQLPPGSAQSLQSLLGSGTKPVTMSLDATQTQVTLEAVARGVPRTASAQPPRLVTSLPGESWLALGVSSFGQSIQRSLTQFGSGGAGQGILSTVRQQLRAQTGLDLDRDVLAALGDLAVFAQGSNLLSLGAGIVIQTPDPAAARRLVDRLQPLIARQGGGTLQVGAAKVAGAQGFRVSTQQLPGALNVVVKGDRLVIAYGDAATQQAFSPTKPLSASPEFKTAQESLDGATPNLFLSFGPLAQLVGAQNDPQAQQASTYLNGLRTLAVGAKMEGDTQTSRFVLTVK